MKTAIVYFMHQINHHFNHNFYFKKKIYSLREQFKLVQKENTYSILKDEVADKENKQKSTNDNISAKIDKISLIVSALEDTEEKAINCALYKAIIETFHTFTSKKLTDITALNKILLNNTIYHYVKKYTKVLDNKSVFVVLEVNINIWSLFSIISSQNSIPIGVTFALSIKEKELNVMNEQFILNDLLEEVKRMIPKSFDLKLEAKNLKDISYKKFGEFLTGSFISNDPRNPYNVGYNKFLRKYKITTDNIENCYLAEMLIHYIPNEKAKMIVQIIIDVLKSISISSKEIYDNYNTKLTAFSIGSIEEDYYQCFYFRSSYILLKKWKEQLFKLFVNEFSSFKIVDNMGIKSEFKSETIFNKNSLNNIYNDIDKSEYNFSKGKGIFKIAIFQSSIMEWYHIQNLDLSYLLNKETDTNFYLRINFLIKKDHIYKYSRFNIEHK